MANPRIGKVAERIQQIVATRLEKGLRDPRLGFVTITDVRVTGDLQHASIFYTVYGSDEEREASGAALKAATGMLRREVGKGLSIRLTPTIEFIADALPESASQMAALLEEARKRDAETKALAVGAKYAGDENPYVTPHADDDSDDDSAGDSDDEDNEDDDNLDDDDDEDIDDDDEDIDDDDDTHSPDKVDE
jgi:ribosome-binding factor A